jgi:hypothetical protein
MRTITIGIVLSFVCLLLFASIVKQIQSKEAKIPWPPHIEKCPTYWTMSSDGKCMSTLKLNGPGNRSKIDPYDESSKISENRKSIRSTDIYWDGISNP